MADRGEAGREPEFAVRMLGYSRTEVDEFVAEVRRELRALGIRLAQSPDEGASVRVITASPRPIEQLPPVSAHLARLLRYAEEEASGRVAEARLQAEQALRSARELADKTAADARLVSQRTLSSARETAERTVAEAQQTAERTVAEARETADRMVTEARERVTRLELKVAETLDREVNDRVAEMADLHLRLVSELGGMRDALTGLLAADAERGPIDPADYQDLVPRQQAAIRQ